MVTLKSPQAVGTWLKLFGHVLNNWNIDPDAADEGVVAAAEFTDVALVAASWRINKDEPSNSVLRRAIGEFEYSGSLFNPYDKIAVLEGELRDTRTALAMRDSKTEAVTLHDDDEGDDGSGKPHPQANAEDIADLDGGDGGNDAMTSGDGPGIPGS